jgi:hypothetical protein
MNRTNLAALPLSAHLELADTDLRTRGARGLGIVRPSTVAEAITTFERMVGRTYPR